MSTDEHGSASTPFLVLLCYRPAPVGEGGLLELTAALRVMSVTF